MTLYNRDIKSIHKYATNLEQLKLEMCDFIVQIRKEKGEQYPALSISELVSDISLFGKETWFEL